MWSNGKSILWVEENVLHEGAEYVLNWIILMLDMK